MFGLGMPEVLLILALALIIIGPKKLPDLAKTLGKSLREFKGAAQDFKNSINIETSITDIDPPAEEIQKNIDEANKDPEDKLEEKPEDKQEKPPAEKEKKDADLPACDKTSNDKIEPGNAKDGDTSNK